MGGSQSSEQKLQELSGSGPVLPTTSSSSSSSGKSQSELAAEQLGFDPSKSSALIQDGRYRVANKSSEKYFYESQPANQKGGVNQDGRLMSSLTVGAEALKATEAAELIRQQVAAQGEKMTVIDNSMSKDEIRRILSESEGLNIGDKRRAELIQTWRFMLASDPIQYGFDAGFLTGGVVAAIALQWKKNRHPVRLASIWCGGFAAGMITFPMAMVFWEEYNMARIVRNEKEMFQAQRDDFHKKSNVVVDAQEVK
jgi:hypothetical protein